MADEIMDAGQDNTDTGMSASGQPPAADQQSQPPVQSPAGQNPQQPTIQVVAAHPKAHLFHSILETLGGGDKTQYSVDPQTGAMSATRVPQTSGQLGKTILAGALTGLFAGAGEHGPGSEGRSAAAGFQAASQQRQQQQAQAQNQAKDDFERQQQQKVRQAQIVKANMEGMRTAYAIGAENDEAKDKFIANHAEDLTNWKNLGVIQDSSVPSDQLMKKGYDPSKYVAIPDGRVPAIKSDGNRATDANGIPLSQLTYSVIDATGQAPLTQAKFDQMVAHGIQKPSDNAIPEGATISSAVLAQRNHKMDAIDQTQAEVDKVAGAGKINLLEEIRKNPGLVDAIEKYHNDNSSTEPDVQINNMDGKFHSQAGLLRNLFGEDNLQAYKENREARGKATVIKQEAEARHEVDQKDPKYQQQLENERLEAQNKRLDIAKKSAEAAPANTQHGPVENGIDNTYIGSLPVEKQAGVKAVGQGRVPYTAQALRTAIGQNYLEILTNAYPGDATHPGFDASRFPVYEKTRMGFTSGKEAQTTRAFSTALEHLKEVNDNIGWTSQFPGIKSIAQMGGLGDAYREKANKLNVARGAVKQELARAYKTGVADKQEVEDWGNLLDTDIPNKLTDNVKEVSQLLKGQFDSLQTQWDNGAPPGVISPLSNMISPQAKRAYKEIRGQDIGFGSNSAGQQQPQQQSQQPVFAKNPQTGARVMSNDGGKTWQPAQ